MSPAEPQRAGGRVCVVGSFMMDIVVRTERRPAAGETVIGDSLAFYLGGKGFNQAVAARRQGVATDMVGRLGADDFGDRFVAALAAEGIGAAAVGRDPKVGTGSGLPVVDAAGENAIVVVPLANTACTPDHVRDAAAVLGAADVVVVQLELPIDTVVAALEVARAAGAQTILDPAPMHPEVGRLRGLVDLVTPNESEAAALLAAAGMAPGDDDADTAARVAEAMGAPRVLLTLGERGAVLFDRGTIHRFAPHLVTVVDTVGAGDATTGVLAAALAGGADLPAAAGQGVAAGSLAVTMAGAEPSMPTGAAVADLLAATATTTNLPLTTVDSGGTP